MFQHIEGQDPIETAISESQVARIHTDYMRLPFPSQVVEIHINPDDMVSFSGQRTGDGAIATARVKDVQFLCSLQKSPG
jgi:hypothetical protein